MTAESAAIPAQGRITDPNGPDEAQGMSRVVWREPVNARDGHPIAWRTRAVVAHRDQTYRLCRCDHSANSPSKTKPLCDGSHTEVSFTHRPVPDHSLKLVPDGR